MKKLLLSTLVFLLVATLAESLRADSTVTFNEIMYHPATNEPTMEWLELRNQLAVDVDISGWSITGGIDYTFASNTIVRGGGFALVALSPATLMAATGATNVLGPFVGRLSNNGDTLELHNNSGRLMDKVSYGVEGDWPVAPDGSGVSLAKRDPDSASGAAENWMSSDQMGGTPRAENFPLLTGALPETRLIAIDATWKYEASGTDLGTAWRGPAYNDTGWASRAAFTNRSIPTLFNTGLGSNGVALSSGVLDPHYILTAAAQGAVPTNAQAMVNNTAWAANDATSVWIGVNNNGANNVNQGGYNYQTTFSLAGFLPSTVRLNLNIAVDNDLTNVFLNGVGTGLATSGFAAFNGPFALSSGFAAGMNTMEFRTVNAGTSANPHGFRATFTSSGLALNTNSPLPLGPTTYYFRKSLNFSGDPAFTQLRLNPVIADGAVVYLNGVEVYRQNMPAGPVAFSTPASSDVASPDYSGPITIPTSNLVVGANVLAVEVHQAAASPDGPLLGAELLSTPVPVPPVTLAFNELSASTNAEFWLELVNYGTNSLSLDGYVIFRDGAEAGNAEYVFPSRPPLAPGSYVALTNTTLGFHPVSGDKLYLLPPARNKVIDSVVVKKAPRARSPDGTGSWLHPNSLTPGGPNSFAFHNEIVINEIMYHAHRLPPTNNLPPRQSPEAWLELFNRSSNAVDLTGWELAGGISYIFTPGQSIPPGGYLVVADDVPYLRALYPAIDIVGEFGGKLSGNSDHIVLKDPSGNPADDVRYFDSGRWPVYASGGGSSLELRDPNADNSKAEAWAASDETGKTSWQTYSYRAVANIPGGSGQPTQWQDFILGLQDIGECLIDDISVIESPATAPAPVIANGDFESGMSGWRVLGTHNCSRVEVDPDNAGNHVLHVVATAYQEHMHNHIERTLIAGKTITAGREYQISFRARWLAGNNLLNTRLYFDRSARTTTLPVPALNGTPGARNSRFVANIGPTFSQFQHQPVIPPAGAPVTVSVIAQDTQGVSSSEVWWSANGGAWTSAAMAHQGGGRYVGTIPGQSAGAIVQFYVRAVDGPGAAATFPAGGTNSGALYIVEDGQAILSLAHNVRIIMTRANTDLMHGTAEGVNQTNVMSNDLLPCTIVYDERRAYYDCGVHLRGSQRGRYSDTRTGFHIAFQADNLFRGVHPVMLIDRSGQGDETRDRQEEIVIKHIMNRAGGIGGTYAEICRLIAPRSAHTGPAQFFPRHEDLFVEEAFKNGGNGTLFEMELIYYPTTANTDGYKNPQPDLVVGTDVTDLGNDKEIYRYNFLIKNHRDADDYRAFIALGKAWSLTGAALDAQTRQLMDMDQWMRAYALVSLCSVGDMYTFGNNHNFFIYQRPSDGKFLYFPWDMDFAFYRQASGALVGDQNLGKIVSLPGNLRCLYAHMLDIIGVSFNTNYMAYWTDHYARFAPGQNYSGSGTVQPGNSLGILGARVPFVRNTINAQTGTNFTVNGANFITTSANLVTLTGTAPAQVKTIWINGREYAVTWTSVSTWTIRVPVSDVTNVLQIVGYDLHGNALTNFTRTVTVNYTGPAPNPEGAVVINEIMYNPLVPDAAYLELFNTSTNFSFDLSGWRINGLDFTFPPGSVITNRQYLVVANSTPSYVAAYGTNAAAPTAQFNGNLQNDGETLTLLRPGTIPGTEIEVDKVRYESVLPWPTSPNGTGPSLQLIDATQDNSRVGNWAGGAAWTKVTKTGNIGTGTNVLIWSGPTLGSAYIDDISLVGPAGTNIVVNGGFETGDIAPWNLGTNYTASTVVSGVSHSGNRSLLLVGGVAGGGSALLNFVQQIVGPAVEPNTNYTLTFYTLFNTNSVPMNMRTLPGNNLQLSAVTQSILSTPGAANSFADTLPPFPPVWLNEAQPENLAGLADNHGEHEPWVEVYNAGTNPVSLAGCYLTTNYGNLSLWPFPPGAMLQPGEFKVVFCDAEPGESTASEWHTNFRLNPGSGSVALAWTPGGGPQVLDYLNYTNIPAGRSYGDYPDGQPFTRQEFFRVTPGTGNDNTAAPLVVYINEWMAANSSTLLNTNNNNKYDDWFELYNPGSSSANLSGYFLTDNLSNKFQFAIPPGFVIPAHGFKLVWADGAPGLNNTNNPDLHVSFKLAQGGEQIGLFAGDGTLIDAVTFEPQFNDISQGRYPDGPGTNYFLASPTPRGPNTIWANRYPTLAPISDATAYQGLLFTFSADGSDPDAPPQMLSFSLNVDAPAGASIDPMSGTFTWTPTAMQTPSTNLLTLRVTDNGTPVLSAARSFRVVVRVPLLLSGIMRAPNGDFSFSIGTIAGKTYRVEYTEDLSLGMWTPLGPDQMATSGSLTVTDNIGAHPRRFYRVVQVD